jgi:hypothetical protein
MPSRSILAAVLGASLFAAPAIAAPVDQALAAAAAPFVPENEDIVLIEKGALGPSPETLLLVTFDLRGRGSFRGFALVPDARAKGGHRKLPLPKLPEGSMEGEASTRLIEDLDRDGARELVLELAVVGAVSSPLGGYTYKAFRYVVLDWDGKRFVRLPVLEKKLQRKVGEDGQPLPREELRKALGLGG